MFGDTETWKAGGKLLVVVVDPADGGRADTDAGGYATYTIDHSQGWKMALVVRELFAATPDVEAVLWQYLTGVDLMHEVRAEVPVDLLLPLQITDQRQVHTMDLRDYLWLRVLDAPSALAARRWSDDIDVVIEVVDDLRPEGAASGRFSVEGGIDGSSCSRTDASPDVVMGVAELGALYLGDVRPSALAAVGRLDERTSGAVAMLDRAVPWSPAPFCATRF
jgi:predicted acetyltransferase